MKWTKITGQNRPEFDKIVFLMQKDYNEDIQKREHQVISGYLESITKDGFQFKKAGDYELGIFELFATNNSKIKTEFKPTHYCEIEIPED